MTRKLWTIGLTAFCLAGAAAAWLFLHPHPSSTPTTASAYADPQSCVRCHRDETAGYNETGMAHAFYAPTAATTIAAPAQTRTYFHPASSTSFSLTAHDGRFFQRRWQKGFDGRDDNVEELSIDYVMGSGNHARTFLHREQDGTLIELPLAWYSQNGSQQGGEFAMNPGFDNATPMTRRVIAYECMFCHNGYPAIPDPTHRDLSAKPVYTSLPMGIDCQRCHGPGAAHVQAASARKPDTAKIHATILNPAHLSNERQMQVCEQCHLETTSTLLPDRIRRYDQHPFGYDPNQPLSTFNAYFTRDPAHGPTNNVEIVNAAYRLRQSKCYLATRGALTCELCHNPHDLHKGPQSTQFYANICLNCHATKLKQLVATKQHTDSQQCTSCHMPQRRTEDVIHAAVTDHLIQRSAPARPLAELHEATSRYNGPVLRYLLDGETPRPDDALYNAVAQVIDSSNNSAAPQLATLLDEQKPREPAFYIELGDALRHNGQLDAAIASYRKALELDPQSSRAARRLGVALAGASRPTEALQVLTTAIASDPTNELLLYERAQVETHSGDSTSAISDLRKALTLRPDYADALNNLGSLLAQAGQSQEAESALRQAVSINPYDAAARSNLGKLLSAQGQTGEAAFQLQRAASLAPSDPAPHLDYAILLLGNGHIPQAKAEIHAALTLNPHSALALDLSGQLARLRGKLPQALAAFQAAAQADPSFAPAQLDTAETFIELGDLRQALPWLQKASLSTNPAVAQRAAQILSRATPSK
ncbi:Flp pilus assembly protein TadD, contains TPR repeats [Bryocella elongata]|uniref:Flp pilus assembly protein TadD, contains TPR repeats n=1 Tax=Bryocella elongata TaxID=863522 RepID=A0A1H6C3E4_9BACT|nr:tetratricopeptide repeat protein [Bryocella elongata]SEG67165.1 Flp pilus assembly protein TadD, contains TPR repeats [Bryocella elongata]